MNSSSSNHSTNERTKKKLMVVLGKKISVFAIVCLLVVQGTMIQGHTHEHDRRYLIPTVGIVLSKLLLSVGKGEKGLLMMNQRPKNGGKEERKGGTKQAVKDAMMTVVFIKAWMK